MSDGDLKLPALQRDCGCVAEDAKPETIAANKAAFKAVQDWEDQESKLYQEWTTKTTWGDRSNEAWRRTEIFKAFAEMHPRPEQPDPLGIGCVECDNTGKQLTEAGAAIVDLMMPYFEKMLTRLETGLRDLRRDVHDIDQSTHRHNHYT